MVLSKEFTKAIRAKYQLDWNGIHGVAHWARVKLNGSILAKHYPGANLKVIHLFAFIHDSCRLNDNSDIGHGERASNFAQDLNDKGIIELNDIELGILKFACRFHTNGDTRADITTQICWDSDRLDLGRVGIKPDAKYLCTDAAKSDIIITQSYTRSMGFKWKR